MTGASDQLLALIDDFLVLLFFELCLSVVTFTRAGTPFATSWVFVIAKEQSILTRKWRA
jgi:hypothetical protein